MSGYIVPDDVTLLRLSRQTKAALRDRLIGTLEALSVPSERVAQARDRAAVRGSDPAQIVADARLLFSVLPAEPVDVVRERQDLLWLSKAAR